MMKRFFYCVLVLILLLSCNKSGLKNGETNIIKSNDSRSLEFWTSDTVFFSNPDLVRLMDGLYQYTVYQFPSDNINDDIEWMQNYREELCFYYKAHIDQTGIDEFGMSDRVIKEARKLWSIDSAATTVGVITENGIELSRLIFDQFNSYLKLETLCNSECQRKALKDELLSWVKLERYVSKILNNLAELAYWDSSFSVVTHTSEILSLWEYHIELYNKEILSLVDRESIHKEVGSFINPAKQLLLDSCSQAVFDYSNEDMLCEGGYNSKYKSTQQLIDVLPGILDDWIEKRAV